MVLPERMFWIVFSDMDGTVLDKDTYQPGPAMEAFKQCLEYGVPVVLNSSKTRAEMEAFYRDVPMWPGTPFISENGGGVYMPYASWKRPPASQRSGDFWKVSLGRPREMILPVLRGALEDVGLRADLFSDLPAEEIAARTGLAVEQARLAMQREFDEPFWAPAGMTPADLKALRALMDEEGLRISRGGRLFHAHGHADKGTAVRYVVGEYQQVYTCPVFSAGVGDAANDLPLLEAVGRAYVVRRSDGTYDPAFQEGRGIRWMSGIGPRGFLQAVEDVVGEIEPPDK